MFKRAVTLLIAATLVLAVPPSAFAADSTGGYKAIQSITALRTTGDYLYSTDKYSPEDQLMPVTTRNYMGAVYSPSGYADRNGNIKIPIHKNWTSAWRFVNGIAIVYDEDKSTYSAIDTNGRVIFNIDGSGDLQVFEDDPNGMYCASVSGNGNSSYGPNTRAINIYDRKGNRIKKDLPYDRIGEFHDGVANLYKISDRYIYGYLGGSPLWKNEYTPVASINSKGEILGEPVSEYTKPTNAENYGFVSERLDNGPNSSIFVLKNSRGKEIYRYIPREKYFSEHHIINQNALLVPVKKDDGTCALTLMDSMGNLYPQYEYCEFQGAFENRFFAIPYKSLAEKRAYVKTLGKVRLEEWEQDLKYVSNAKDSPIEKLQSLTLYEIQLASDPIYAGNNERLWGDDRYKTAVAISKKGWEKSDNVILVDGNNFPDALVGSSFAYLKDAPILITPSGALNSDTVKEIERLGAKTVYILGSYASVSKAVEDELKKRYDVIRIGGTEVFDTAVKVGEEIRKIKQFDTAAIATQNDFPDALSIAPFSAKNTMPILFSEKGRLRQDTKKALNDWGIKHVVISGGTGVVSSAVENEIRDMGITVERLSGEDRYNTALDIVRYFGTQNGYANIAVATGEDYPDALTGAVFAAKNNIPIILVNKNTVDVNVLKYINAYTVDKAYIFGGPGVVYDSVVNKPEK